MFIVKCLLPIVFSLCQLKSSINKATIVNKTMRHIVKGVGSFFTLIGVWDHEKHSKIISNCVSLNESPMIWVFLCHIVLYCIFFLHPRANLLFFSMFMIECFLYSPDEIQ